MKCRFYAIWVLAVALLLGCSSAGSDESSAIDPVLRALLDHYDRHYDPTERMLQLEFDNPGYHSRVPTGTLAHPTRESLVYALALLQRDESGDADRAAEIVAKVIRLQDTNPASSTYGIWSWLLEEPLPDMSAPDFNWADFCGAQIAHMLIKHADQLPAELRADMRESLRHAVCAIRKRDVKPGYTNIAILGACVCAAAGELFDDAGLLEYGRRRMQRVVEHTAEHGSFNEYNSPPYTCVALVESERTLELVRDPATREAAEALRRIAWEIIADSFHPGTQQWAGPHSRSYEDRLRVEISTVLSRRLGLQITPHPSVVESGEPSDYAAVRPLSSPENVAAEFRSVPTRPYQLSRIFVRGKTEADSTIGTTWFAPDACLGSVNRSMLWTQRKPLIAYWKTDEDPAVVFRLRFLHDGKDFASMGVRTAQEGPRVLAVLKSERNRGDWHPSLDRPADGVFFATDLRVRLELRGVGVTAEELGGGRYALLAGSRRVVILTVPGQFVGKDVEWQPFNEGDRAYLDGICYHGDRRAFDFSNPLDISVAVGIELLQTDETVADHAPVLSHPSPGQVKAVWEIPGGDLLTVPADGG